MSGRPYAVVLRDTVLKPAGMRDTGFDPGLWPATRLAQGYQMGSEGDERWGTVVGRFDERGPSWYLVGNGGLHSTAADMLRFRRALEGDVLLSPESKKKAFTGHVAENESGTSHYGYGWAMWNEPDSGRVVAHNGGNMIFFADFQRYVDEDLFVFLASSRRVRGTQDLGTQLARIVLDPEFAPLARQGVSLRTDQPGDDLLASKWGLADSPLGRMSARFLAALANESRRNELTEGMYTERLLDKIGAERLLGLFDRLSGDLGEFEFVSAERFGDTRVDLTLRPTSGPDVFVVGLDFADGKIDGIGVEVSN